ncbi:LVIVD repeat-containing protein [Winogradskyella ursingii]|uniref:LVIVD repeat-containing protein n=1 Tax=Winogradskyella ursingii TaxID=2686079 RepID=UPI001C53D512|nr:hypothetical protein [Winogradskyella ursingii]
MKNLILVLALSLIWSCDTYETQTETFIATVAIPETISKAEWRAKVEVKSPKPIEAVGKIYAYQNYIFINEKLKGVHVIDNTNPLSPQFISFINIPGNEDIAIKNNYLFADNAIDLVVFNISDINNIKEVERLGDVFDYYFEYTIPAANNAFIDFENYDRNTEVIVGWTYEEREFAVNYNEDYYSLSNNDASQGGNAVGTGGSLARFQIVEDYLYTVGEYELNAFNISNLALPTFVNSYHAGWNIETMFHSDGYLYLGGDNGMYIHSIQDPANPQFISEFNHWQGCDPVVVDGDYAYLTLRGGNECGQELSVLEVIDVSDKSNPVLAARHNLDSPYGLGYNSDRLFVCDGASGLKVYDKSNPLDLQLVADFSDVQATDVIPLQDRLLMISENALYQYEYNNENSIELISTFMLN